jgi:hypothetical protein
MRLGRGEYNLIGTDEDPIPPNEPCFLLRGQDALAETVVRIYAVLAGQAGRWDIERSALDAAEEISKWPTKKMPEL